MMFVTFSSAMNFRQAGQDPYARRDLAPAGLRFPDVPTMREQGFDMGVGSWQGIYVPKGTPKPVIDKLFDITQQTMKHADVVKRLNEGGVAVVVSKSPADFRKFWEAEDHRFAKIIKAAKIETE
jgi:tripartite-type tricarboxylate transporter receptor subunit TctC